jgi:hypothetical protein
VTAGAKHWSIVVIMEIVTAIAIVIVIVIVIVNVSDNEHGCKRYKRG